MGGGRVRAFRLFLSRVPQIVNECGGGGGGGDTQGKCVFFFLVSFPAGCLGCVMPRVTSSRSGFETSATSQC